MIDFGWLGVGALISTYLAAFGADVIKVESATHPDVVRAMPPYKDGIPGLNRSGFFANMNSNKHSITLRMDHPRALDIARNLIAISDVVVENFTPGTMEKWGLSYEDIRKFKPDIVMVSSSMTGAAGPYSGRRGYGAVLSALCGFPHFTGWPDREPAGTATSYTDFVVVQFAVASLLAALDKRRKTGEGCYIQQSQFETALYFLQPAILDYFVNHRVESRWGNRAPNATPHGIFRCKGHDRWCAIAIFNEEEWAFLCQAMGEPPWASASKFSSILGRKDNEDELERLVEAWSIDHTREEVVAILRSADIAAGVVADGFDIHEDSQLKYRHHFWELEHPEMGRCTYDAPPAILSETPAMSSKPAPCMGQDNAYIYTEVLGMSETEFINLLREGVFE